MMIRYEQRLSVHEKRGNMKIVAQRKSFRTRLGGPNRLVRIKQEITDTWLQRLSHLSQFGLFLFTVGTIYFTVIPLYQKALLDEAIAKKEIDLIEATKAVTVKERELAVAQTALLKKTKELDSTTNALAQAELKVYVQRRGSELGTFIHFVSAECSGLLIRLPKGAELKPREKAQFEELLDLSPDKCLEKNFRESALKRALKPTDLAVFESELFRTAARLIGLREKSIEDLNGIEAKAMRDPRMLVPPGPFEAQGEALFARANAALLQGRPLDPVAAEIKQKKDFQRAVVRTKDAHARKYMDDVREAIRKLGSESWPKKMEPSQQ